ncbi:OstA-like protein [Aureibacter tunicatorum]|uniref:Lipopolysaccharide export system protein LptA n=1 Tax=Aureibacter tunicatorum TaxID=866807 RepID=A0AAE3XIW2_9BACT|nr:OstA-like protein [Aureibacter tunicatorum]MDR6237662.1 lipopolysaccharide export system protein LptA [Aureibacter tunicatorum]BDD02697.1 hypothetical protein AUTU_01800 [Aureibacter tunicatorum]
MIKQIFGALFFLSFAINFLNINNAIAQKKEKVNYKSDSLRGGTRDGERFEKLIHNVEFDFKKRDSKIYCDSAFFFRKAGRMECYGNVRVHEGDSITIISKKLIYDTRERLARMREDVIYTDKTTKLYTDTLNYYVETRSARYWGGGRIIDGANELISEEGIYNTATKNMNFWDSVRMKSPEYNLRTDSLVYNTNTKIAETFGETESITPEGYIIDSPIGAIYNLSNENTVLPSGTIESEEYMLKGDTLTFNQTTGLYTAKNNVFLENFEEQLIITGTEAKMNKQEGITKIYGNPLMKKIMEADTFYLKADTLVSIEDQVTGERFLLAYDSVQIFKSNLQGLADSISYHVTDSTIYMYTDPVLWNDNNQATADTISILISSAGLKQMDLYKNAFMILEDSLGQFNQLRGRDIFSYFSGQELSKMDVIGNSENLYYAMDERKGFLGINRIICSSTTMYFSGGQPAEVIFYTKPEARFIPPHEIDEQSSRLKGFQWLGDMRPTRKSVLRE